MEYLKAKYLKNYNKQKKLTETSERLERLEIPYLKAKMEKALDELAYKSLFLVNKIGFGEIRMIHEEMKKMHTQVKV